ncbi:hypothetical protein C8A03DRAFT_17559, partial [Achaetomium macrosporum]
ERLEILEWVSPIPYRQHHNTVKEARTPGTCQWFLQCKAFREWEAASSSVIIWLQGSPGAGKTFLASQVVDHVQAILDASPNHEGFAFFYCNRHETDRRKPLSILRSYVCQLSTVASTPGEMRGKLRNLYRETRLRGSHLTLEACKEQLLESVNLYPRTTLVLDALDECEPDTRSCLVDTLEFLLQRSERPLKIFISSRPDGDIRDRFLSRPNIEIQATDNQDDITKFVNEEIIKRRRWGKLSPALREDIVKTLLHGTQGMFQWAFLQIKQLLELRTEAAIKDRLGKLPSTIEGTYNEIYGNIAARNEHERVLADRAFMWVMCACRPLSSVELLGAIRLDPTRDTVRLSDEVDEDLLLDICHNLLVLDSQQRVWRFSHLSVTEYFEKSHWSLRQAHCHAAGVCLLLLINTRQSVNNDDSDSWNKSANVENERGSGPDNIFDPEHRLQVYCRHHWMIHVQGQEGSAVDPALTRRLKTFLGSPGESSSHYRAWYRQTFRNGSEMPSPKSAVVAHTTKRELSPETSAVLAMCRFGFYSVLLDWWADAEFTIPVETENELGDNLLTLAAVAGCRPICEALLDLGMQINVPAQKGRYGSPLAAAVYEEEFEIVKFLIERGAKSTCGSGLDDTPAL